jgi:hypothetical protein
MAETKYDNSGAMFVNERKEKETHPDRQGSATIAGVEYWVSGWIKEGKNGKWLSLAFKRKEETMTLTTKPKKQPERNNDLDNDIPFR